jgi:hypothetical protein
MSLPKSRCSTLFMTVCQSPLKKKEGLLLLAWAFGFGFYYGLLLWDVRLLLFALGFMVWEALGREKNY